MDKKAEILDRAARMAIIRSGVEKNANMFSRMKNFATGPIRTKKVTHRLKPNPKKGGNPFMEKSTEDIDPKEGWTPMKLLGVVAAGVITNQFINKMISFGERKGIEMQSPIFFRKMLKANPKVMEMDPEEVTRVWKTLYNTAPHLAQDPIAAGGYIVQTINGGLVDEFGSPSMDSYKTLVDLENKIQDNRESDTPNAFGSIAGALSAGALG